MTVELSKLEEIHACAFTSVYIGLFKSREKAFESDSQFLFDPLTANMLAAM